MDEHYTRAKSTVFGSWYESDMRSWLVEHGYLKSDAQAKREEVSSCPAKYGSLTNLGTACRSDVEQI